MTWADLGELIRVAGAIATAGAACVGATIAWRGLEKWRSETVGKKRAEIAIAALADFYQFEDLIRQARSPWVMNHEMSKIEGVSDEVASDSAFAPERRLREHADFFARFRSRKHEFAAVFGKESAKPFDEMWNVRLEINSAVDSMLTHKEIRSERNKESRELWASFHTVAFRSTEESKDQIILKVSAAVIAIERVCRPAIDAIT